MKKLNKTLNFEVKSYWHNKWDTLWHLKGTEIHFDNLKGTDRLITTVIYYGLETKEQIEQFVKDVINNIQFELNRELSDYDTDELSRDLKIDVTLYLHQKRMIERGETVLAL